MAGLAAAQHELDCVLAQAFVVDPDSDMVTIMLMHFQQGVIQAAPGGCGHLPQRQHRGRCVVQQSLPAAARLVMHSLSVQLHGDAGRSWRHMADISICQAVTKAWLSAMCA